MGLNEYLDNLLELQDKWQANHSPIYGQATGFKSIDEVTGGLHAGEVTIIGARTSHGKTSLASQIAFNVATDLFYEFEAGNENPGKVMIFSPEMTPEQLLLRQACMMAEVPSRIIRTGRANETQLNLFHEKVRLLRNLDRFVYLRASGSLDVNDLTGKVEEQNIRDEPVRLVVVDYLQRLTDGTRSGSYDRASSISLKIKDLALRQKVPVLLLSQLNRAVEKRKNSDDPEASYPELSDLRESGRIEEDADGVWLLWRPVQLQRVDEIDNMEAQIALVRIAKNRNGPVAGVPLRFYPSITKFLDTDPEKVEYA